MSKIKNYLMGEVESGRMEYNPKTGEYQPTAYKGKCKMYAVYLEGMDLGLRFFNREDAEVRAGSYGIDASVGYIMED